MINNFNWRIYCVSSWDLNKQMSTLGTEWNNNNEVHYSRNVRETNVKFPYLFIYIYYTSTGAVYDGELIRLERNGQGRSWVMLNYTLLIPALHSLLLICMLVRRAVQLTWQRWPIRFQEMSQVDVTPVWVLLLQWESVTAEVFSVDLRCAPTTLVGASYVVDVGVLIGPGRASRS